MIPQTLTQNPIQPTQPSPTQIASFWIQLQRELPLAAGCSLAARTSPLQPLPGCSPGATTRRRSWLPTPAKRGVASGAAHPRPRPRPLSQVRPRDFWCSLRLMMPLMAAEMLAPVHLPPLVSRGSGLPPRPTAVLRASHVSCAQVASPLARRPTLPPKPATPLLMAGGGVAGGSAPRPPTSRRRAAPAPLPHPPPRRSRRWPRPPPTTARAAPASTTARPGGLGSPRPRREHDLRQHRSRRLVHSDLLKPPEEAAIEARMLSPVRGLGFINKWDLVAAPWAPRR